MTCTTADAPQTNSLVGTQELELKAVFGRLGQFGETRWTPAIGTNPDLQSGLRSGRYQVITGPSAPPGQHCNSATPGNSTNSLGSAAASRHRLRTADDPCRPPPLVGCGEITFKIGDEVTVRGPGTCAFLPRCTARLEKYRCRNRTRAVSLYPGRCRRLFRGTAGAAGRVRQWTGGHEMRRRHGWEIVGPPPF